MLFHLNLHRYLTVTKHNSTTNCTALLTVSFLHSGINKIKRRMGKIYIRGFNSWGLHLFLTQNLKRRSLIDMGIWNLVGIICALQLTKLVHRKALSRPLSRLRRSKLQNLMQCVPMLRRAQSLSRNRLRRRRNVYVEQVQNHPLHINEENQKGV